MIKKTSKKRKWFLPLALSAGTLAAVVSSRIDDIGSYVYDVFHPNQARSYKIHTEGPFRKDSKKYRAVKENVDKGLQMLDKHFILLSADWCRPCKKLKAYIENECGFKPYNIDVTKKYSYTDLEDNNFLLLDLTNANRRKTVYTVLEERDVQCPHVLPVLLTRDDETNCYTGFGSNGTVMDTKTSELVKVNDAIKNYKK